MEESERKSKIAFGIGCFHFGVKKRAPFKFRSSDYLKELRIALQSISNVDVVNIYCDDEFENISIDIEESLPNIGEGVGCFPKPLFMTIEFELHIPYRIQAEILQINEELLRTYTEKFKVSIRYTYHCPVTLVELISPSNEGEPSFAVIVVREFIKQELEKQKSDYIQFECLGPSPFHVDCYIKKSDKDDNKKTKWDIEAERVAEKGYDDIIFYYNPEIFKSVQDAKHFIFYDIEDELGFFYYIVQTEVLKMKNWNNIEQLENKLISIQKEKGIKGILKRIFSCSKLLNDAFISVAEFESEELYFQNFIQEHFRYIYSKKEESVFKYFLRNEIDEKFTYPVKQLIQLLTLFESRRTKSIEILVVLLSAIIGGAIGSLLTLIVTR